MNKQTKVLFVCLGNICRSPAAEGIFKSIIDKKNISENYYVDSAGTSGHHDGEKADSRMLQAAKEKGIDLTSISRKFVFNDFKEFDHIVVMDDSNYENVIRMDTSNEFSSKVHKMANYSSEGFQSFKEIPDPYFGGEEGFVLVLDLLKNTCSNFLEHID